MRSTFIFRLICLFLFIANLNIACAVTKYFFFVQFTDKANTPYSLENPSEFLSERALERRQYFHIICDSTDLPVNPNYAEQVKLHGFKIHNTTKWFNGVTVSTEDSASVNLINTLDFVGKTEYTGKRIDNTRKKANKTEKIKKTIAKDSYNSEEEYGAADEQIKQIKGKYLHNLGYRGEGIYIAVLDGGFSKVNITPAYNHLFLQNKLLGTKDFVDEEADPYQEHYHGAYVLSTMAAYLPNIYIGTAPDASYWLIRTEDARSEYPVEMDFWISGIEFADSVGVDVVNSSLGYTVFNDTTLNLTHEDLNGENTRISRAAELAYKKGIIVVNAAGNEGERKWKKIGVPADAKGIITVGGVNINGAPSSFSSYGPSYDGRVKPEILARASNTAVVTSNGVSTGNGTSYASPIIAGMMACFLQAAKDKGENVTLNDLFQLVFESASKYYNPTEKMGYGIPDFEKASRVLLNTMKQELVSHEYANIYTDTMSRTLHVHLLPQYQNLGNYVQIYSMRGELITQREFSGLVCEISTAHYSSGIYAVCLVMSSGETISSNIFIN